jgi:hypothetical protein
MTDSGFDAAIVARYVLAAVFLTAGLGKLLKLRHFSAALMSGGILGSSLRVAVMIGIPAIEALLPIWLVSAADPTAATLATLAVLTMLSAYVVLLRWKGRDPACGCFSAKGRISDRILSRNAGLGCLAAASLFPGIGALLCATGAGLIAFSSAPGLNRQVPA